MAGDDCMLKHMPTETLFGADSITPALFAAIVFDRPLDHAYTYAVPDFLEGKVGPGKRVEAPFVRAAQFHQLARKAVDLAVLHGGDRSHLRDQVLAHPVDAPRQLFARRARRDLRFCAHVPLARQQYEQQGSKWGAYPSYNIGPKTPAATAPPVSPTAGSATTSQAASPTLTPALVARPGDAGPAARVLMEALIARGAHPDAPASRDSDYGADDNELVLQFQRDHGLTVDGVVGPQTWSELLATVNPDETGPMVKVLQTVLIVRSLIRDAVANLDGIYGPMTQQRVRDFQKVSGIDPIAIVGPETWTALLGVKHTVTTRGLPGEDDPEPDLDDLDFLAALDGLPAE